MQIINLSGYLGAILQFAFAEFKLQMQKKSAFAYKVLTSDMHCGTMITQSKRRYNMTICYNRLWKLLIDRGMKKGELKERANISSSSMAKLAKNENVNTDILIKVCSALDCDLSDIMELIKTEKE